MPDILTFCIARRETDPPSGFELGDLTVVGPLGTATSIGKVPDQGMMIYLAAAHLMGPLAELICYRGGRHHEFVGVDSSFRLVFERRNGRRIAIRQGRRMIAEEPAEIVGRRLLEEVDRFWAQHPLPEGDGARGDFLVCRGRLRDALAAR